MRQVSPAKFQKWIYSFGYIGFIKFATFEFEKMFLCANSKQLKNQTLILLLDLPTLYYMKLFPIQKSLRYIIASKESTA